MQIFQIVKDFKDFKENLLLNMSDARNLFLLKISLTPVIPAFCHSLANSSLLCCKEKGQHSKINMVYQRVIDSVTRARVYYLCKIQGLSP